MFHYIAYFISFLFMKSGLVNDDTYIDYIVANSLESNIWSYSIIYMFQATIETAFFTVFLYIYNIPNTALKFSYAC